MFVPIPDSEFKAGEGPCRQCEPGVLQYREETAQTWKQDVKNKQGKVNAGLRELTKCSRRSQTDSGSS